MKWYDLFFAVRWTFTALQRAPLCFLCNWNDGSLRPLASPLLWLFYKPAAHNASPHTSVLLFRHVTHSIIFFFQARLFCMSVSIVSDYLCLILKFPLNRNTFSCKSELVSHKDWKAHNNRGMINIVTNLPDNCNLWHRFQAPSKLK